MDGTCSVGATLTNLADAVFVHLCCQRTTNMFPKTWHPSVFVYCSAGTAATPAWRSLRRKVGQLSVASDRFLFYFLPPAPNEMRCVCSGQMQVWNPDEPSTPRGSANPLSPCLEERLRVACSELDIVLDSCVGHSELLALCQHLGLEVRWLQFFSWWHFIHLMIGNVTGSCILRKVKLICLLTEVGCNCFSFLQYLVTCWIEFFHLYFI